MEATIKCPVSDNVTLSFVSANNVSMVIAQDGDYSAFAGICENEYLNTVMDGRDRMSELLVRAVNNRTRERNYFRMYCELLQGDISDEEFEREIEGNSDEYVVSEDIDADINDIAMALAISERIKDVNDMDDVSSLFSFSKESTLKCIEQR